MKKLIVLALVAMSSMSAFAAEYRIGVDTDAFFSSRSGDTTEISVGGEVAKIFGNLELGLALRFSSEKTDPADAVTSLPLAVVVGYYLDGSNIVNSFFARGYIGFSNLIADDAAGQSNDLAWKLAVGKNIKLSDSVSWSPNVSYSSVATDPEASTDFSITPVALSIFL